MPSFLIADDHEVVRRGLRQILQDEFPSADIADVATARDLLASVRERGWDLIILDIVMPDSSVTDVFREVRQARPDTRVLVLTAVSETQYAVQLIAAGANGYITKREASEVLVQAVHTILRGETFLSREAVEAVAGIVRGETPALPHNRLSPRELEVFLLIARGRTVKEIAATLAVSDKTVATYMTRIREKTNLQSYVDMARYAIHHGLVD